MKGRASTSAQCVPVRRIRARKRKGQLSKESAETQTLESSLVVEPSPTKVSIGVDTTGTTNDPPPSYGSIRGVNEYNTTTPNATTTHQEPATTHQEPATTHQEPATTHQEPATTVSTEISVQTEEASIPNEYSTIETQTMCSDQELLSLFNNLDDQDDNDDYFLQLDMNDIETQTNWNEMNDTSIQTMDASTCIDEFLKDFTF